MLDLFANFEVNKQPRWPIISKLLLGSLVLHAICAASVVYVPGLRSAFNLASLVADTRFVDKDYERTQIGDDVQFVELAGDKFHYPEGYFAPEGQLAVVPSPTPFVPSFVAQVQPPAVQPELGPSPSPSPSPVAAGPSSTSTPRAGASPAAAIAQAKGIPSPSPTQSPAMTADQAQTELEKVAEKENLTLPKEGEINKQALKDFAIYAKKKGKLDFNQPFEIIIEAELDQDGKLKNAKFTKKAGDANLVDLFGRMVAALNDSGFLIYLKPLDQDNPGSKVVFTIKQGESEVLATVESEASSEESARILAKGFQMALALGAQSRAGKDEEALLRSTSAEPVGKKIVFNFTMPRQAVVDLIKKQLAEKPS
ncbi:MAG TPA: hypothetical protein VGO56_07700 [Pyrinomonadaceae bacterium]|jgi:hypothetical protein|nr:hypothetical protein [Pyrinomonadaceae bacterium]